MHRQIAFALHVAPPVDIEVVAFETVPSAFVAAESDVSDLVPYSYPFSATG